MKQGDFVIHRKGTGLFFSRGDYHKPIFSGFLDAWPFSEAEGAIDAAMHMFKNKSVPESMQILRIPELPNIFDCDSGLAARLSDIIEQLSDLDKEFDATNTGFRWLRQAVLESKASLERQAIFVGVLLAGEDVVAEVSPEQNILMF